MGIGMHVIRKSRSGDFSAKPRGKSESVHFHMPKQPKVILTVASSALRYPTSPT